MKKYQRITSLLLASFMIMSFFNSVASAESVGVIINSSRVSLSQDAIIKNNRTYLPLRSFSEHMGFKVRYDAASSSISLTRPKTELILELDQNVVTLNGISISNSDSPFIQNGTTYVPLRFIETATKGKIQWNKKTNEIIVTDEPFIHYSDAKADYWVSFESGKVYFSQEGEIHELNGANVKPLERGKIKTNYFGNQSHMLIVDDEHGAHLNIFHNRYQFLVKNGVVIESAYYTYSGNYTAADFQKVGWDQNYLFDGKILQLIDDSGTLSEKYNLNTITGEKGPFVLDYLDPEFALVRPASSLQLIYIDLNKESSEVLYQILLTEEEQKLWESVDDVGDSYFVSTLLKLEKRDGDTLHLSYRSPVTNKVVHGEYQVH